ncbi:MAG: Smr/MutS family protein [Hyphomicrobiaceae bacterium]
MPARPQSTSTSGAAVPSSSSARRVQRHPTTLDANTVRAISRRHGAIDGRIDLHGMTQAEAHAALRGFLTRAHRQGHRTVLVITGKGLTLADEQAGPWWDATHPARGVLRRSLPGWLAAPDLAPIVVGYAEAHDRHGGGGAFYVRLRLMGPVVRR